MKRPKPLYSILSFYVNKNEWLHLTIGIFGNLCFICGSVAFLNNHEASGWLFLAGGIGMTINAAGNLIAKLEYHGKTAITDVGSYYKHGQNKEEINNV